MGCHIDQKFRPHAGVPKPGVENHDEDLLWYLDEWESKGVRFTEVTHIASTNFLCYVPIRGPLKHHGLIFKAEGGGWAPWYLGVHMTGNPDISWKVYESFQVPQSAVYYQTYPVTKQNPRYLRNFLATTKPWFFPGNDCRGWAIAAMDAVGAVHRPWGNWHGLVISPQDRFEANRQHKAVSLSQGQRQPKVSQNPNNYGNNNNNQASNYIPAPPPQSAAALPVARRAAQSRGVLPMQTLALGAQPKNVEQEAEVDSDSEPSIIEAWFDRVSGLLRR